MSKTQLKIEALKKAVRLLKELHESHDYLGTCSNSAYANKLCKLDADKIAEIERISNL